MRRAARRSVSWVGVVATFLAGLPAPAAPPASGRRIERVESKANIVEGGGRWAVVIGVDKYVSKDITPLGGAVADAKAVSAALIKYADFPPSQVFTLTTDAAHKPTAENVLQKLADIKASVATFRSRGVEFIGEPHLIAKMPDHELWMAFFRDPDGRLIGLMSEVR